MYYKNLNRKRIGKMKNLNNQIIQIQECTDPSFELKFSFDRFSKLKEKQDDWFCFMGDNGGSSHNSDGNSYILLFLVLCTVDMVINDHYKLILIVFVENRNNFTEFLFFY